MCGVAGVMALKDGGLPASRESLTAMAAALHHRGPDEFGLYRDRSAGLVHARLSIIDLASGQQPMSNEDDTLWVVFNGEIFNYVELREELVALGHRFRTRSDTEVIVHAFEAWGEEAFSRFNGQFAIALWDATRERMILARDPLGVRPLYLCEHGDRLYFASEVKAIFQANPEIPRGLDPVGLAQTFTFWSVVPPQSVFARVRELQPGHLCIVSRQGRRLHRFFQPRFPREPRETFGGTLEDAARAVRDALENAVALRMLRADVPVGSYLSGGLDSSLVAALGRRVKGERFRTYSLRFQDAEYDETEYQRAVAASIDSEHHELVVSRRDIAEVFPRVVRHAERPILRTAPAPLFLLSNLVRETGVKVVLTGEGADEMFAGYDLFREGKVRRFWARQPDSRLRPLLLQRLYPYLARSPVSQQAMAREFFGQHLDRWRSPGFAHDLRWSSAQALYRLFTPELREEVEQHPVIPRLLDSMPEDFSRWSPLAQDQYLEVHTLLSGYLLSSQGDRMLMAHSVEGRFPFLDKQVVALANTLPDDYKLRVLDEKHVLKRAAEGLVPEAILRRPKQPFRAPDALSFVGGDAPGWIDEVMSERVLAEAQVFNVCAARELLRKCRQRAAQGQFSNADNMALVAVLSTQLLHDQFVRRLPGTNRPIEFRTFVDLTSQRAIA